MKLLIFGDSIAWGAWDKDGGWVARLQRDANSKTTDTNFEKYQAVYNLGVSGDKTDNVIERFERELSPRLNEEGECLEFVFAVGINDSLCSNTGMNYRTDPEKFKRNIKTLVNLGRKYTKRIAFTGLTPVDESKVDPVPWVPGESYKNEYVKIFDNILKEVCLDMGVVYISLFKKMYESDYKELLEDGVHPNTAGHEMIYTLVKKELEKEGMI